jgi:uncharacterized phage-associated protein
MNAKSNSQARSAAKAVLTIATDMGIPLTGFKLIKLIYFCHRVMLNRFGRPFISNESFLPWKYGPTLESLHICLKPFQGRCLDINAGELRHWPDMPMDDHVKSSIEATLRQMGTMSAKALSDIAFKSDFLWRSTVGKESIGPKTNINPR